MKKYGFTLAEVLITLAIIGVIAAVTIPTLFEEVDLDEKETVTRLNKTITAIDSATKMLAVNEFKGSMENNDCPRIISGASVCMRDYYCKYLNCVKKDVKYQLKLRNGTQSFALTQGTAQLADGIILLFQNWVQDGKCNNTATVFYKEYKTYSDNTADLESASDFCGLVAFDINGADKGSNIRGTDIFQFAIGKRGIKWQ